MSYHTKNKELKELDEDLDEVKELVLMSIVSEYINNYLEKIPCRTLALTKELWVHNILAENPRQCQEAFCMPVSTFEALEK